MILTCPACATRYFLPDVQIGRSGRTVKCANCGNLWRAEPEPEEVEVPQINFDAEVPPNPGPSFSSAEPEPDNEAEFNAAAERRARQQGLINAAIWAALAAAIAIALVCAIIFRIEVVKLAPRMATAYAAIGMPVNASGLLIDKVQAAPAMVGGRRGLNVTGVLTNVAAKSRPAPAFRVSILDSTGKTLSQKIIQVPAQALKVGETRRFLLQVADPPPGAIDVMVAPAPPAAEAPKSHESGAH
jgi:predicted Zn finger-like uncharacterized protein